MKFRQNSLTPGINFPAATDRATDEPNENDGNKWE
ncbi:hypothetical protein RSAG8_02664, partial [Rhizoctonia solani AG-8 WAC10335]